MAARADALGLPVLTPDRLRPSEVLSALAAVHPELLVVADYGRLIPLPLLELARHGALNLHPSLLPRWRGASPIAAAIAAGDAVTGVSLMRLDAGLDTGPLLAQTEVVLDGSETAEGLEVDLARLAAALLVASLGPFLRGELIAQPQDEARATICRPLRREDGRLDPGRPAVELERRVRAYQPWPGTYLDLTGGRLIVHRAKAWPPVPAAAAAGGRIPFAPDAAPGTIVAEGDGLALITEEGVLALLDVQAPGGRRMAGAELRRGRPGLVGQVARGLDAAPDGRMGSP